MHRVRAHLPRKQAAAGRIRRSIGQTAPRGRKGAVQAPLQIEAGPSEGALPRRIGPYQAAFLLPPLISLGPRERHLRQVGPKLADGPVPEFHPAAAGPSDRATHQYCPRRDAPQNNKFRSFQEVAKAL